MGEGAGSPPRPGAPLPSASLRARSPESRCAPQPAVRWASVWGPSCRPTAAPLREGSRTERGERKGQRRGAGRSSRRQRTGALEEGLMKSFVPRHLCHPSFPNVETQPGVGELECFVSS